MKERITLKIKRCPLCDHSFDYHRVKSSEEGKLIIKCVKWMGTRDKDGKLGCECNAGFNNKVNVEYTLHEEYTDWRFGNGK